ncbi:MAG: hypothetical protein V2A77_01150 [Pseudomonadota bacterium]
MTYVDISVEASGAGITRGGVAVDSGEEKVPTSKPAPPARANGAAGRRQDAGFQSLHAKIQDMGMTARLGLALKGDAEARRLLIKNPTKLIQLAVISNARIQDSEVACIAKSRAVNEEVLRRIAESKQWCRNYEIRFGLVLNPRTPLPIVLRMLSTLNRRDLQNIAKSKNVQTVVVDAARRLLMPVAGRA